MIPQLTKSQILILRGLAHGSNHPISATEMEDFPRLASGNLVNTWMGQGMIPMWSITDEGKAEVERLRGYAFP